MAPPPGPRDAPRPALPRRDRIAVLVALGATSAIAWSYLVWMAIRMQGMGEMDGAQPMGAMAGAALQIRPWTALDLALVFVMWAVMMVLGRSTARRCSSSGA